MPIAPPKNRTTHHHGVRLAYAVTGHGPPVLFIHGVGIGGAGWQPQVDGLADRFACLRFDPRGFGGSGRPDGRPPAVTVDLMAGDAAAVMDAFGWTDAHVVGHSLGGLIALQLAAKFPQRVRSLALLCTFANGRAAAPPTLRMLWLGTRSRVGTRRQRRRAFMGLILSPAGLAAVPDADARARDLAKLFGHDLADPPAIVPAQLKAMRATDLTAALPTIAVPTLVVAGAHDPIAPPPLGRTLVAAIPGARYVQLDDGSHGLTIEHADRINQLLAEHFAAAQ